MIFSFVAVSVGIASLAHAQMTSPASEPALRTKRILERISGAKAPGDHPLLAQMMGLVSNGNVRGAATLALADEGFLNITVKQMALKMSTRAETVRTPLNDMTATFVGLVRDDLDARLLLTGNFSYIADANRIPAGLQVRSNVASDIVRSNNHYQDLDRPDVDLAEVLTRADGQQLFSTQAGGLAPNPDPAGVITSRAFLGAHADAGTNRRPVEYIFREFMCAPMTNWSDITASDARIGRDIDRFPGGDHMKFQTNCKGCHTQLDGFRGALAKWDFRNGSLVHSSLEAPNANGFRNGVSTKLNANADVYPDGYVTANSSWINNAISTSNAAMFGWRGQVMSGNDLRELTTVISNSRRFSQCMVKRVYESICHPSFSIENQSAFTDRMAQAFESNGYKFKNLFAEVAAAPECGL